MIDTDKTTEELIQELKELRESYISLQTSFESDIAALSQSDKDLRESRQWMKDIISSMTDWAWEVDKNGIYTYTSQKGIDLYGDSIGKTPFDLMPPAEAKRVALLFTEIAKNKLPIKDLENWTIGKNGEKICLLTNGVSILDEKGNLKGYRGVDKVITGQKQAEELLRDSEEKFRMLFNANMDSISILKIEPDGSPSNFIELNDAAASIFGYSKEELFSLNIQDIEVEVPEEIRKSRIETIKSTGKVDFETTILDKAGNKRNIETKALLVNVQNQLALMNISRDVTEKKKMLEDLIKSKVKAEESDKLKDAFLNNISHEIRTPFNGILGFLSILQSDDLTVSEREEYITIINQSAYRLMNTLNDIVEISQIQAGQSKLHTTETNIKLLIAELYDHFILETENKGIKFNITNGLPSIIKHIHTDSSKLQTILMNLIGNAIKFTKTGSVEVNIRLSEENYDNSILVTKPAELEFLIKDTGTGIPWNKQQAIFERFSQVDVSSTRQFEGSGLGLPISKAYIEMLSGKIWVESEEGIGSNFYFTIPLKAITEKTDKNTEIVPDVVSEDKIGPLKILIAEDDETSSLLLQMVIKPFSKEVLIAKSGAEAIEYCSKNPDIDLVLMDIKMPDINGYDATRQIRKFNAGLVIIAQTAYVLEGDREKAMDAGCNDHISKPIKKNELIEVIQKYF